MNQLLAVVCCVVGDMMAAEAAYAWGIKQVHLGTQQACGGSQDLLQGMLTRCSSTNGCCIDDEQEGMKRKGWSVCVVCFFMLL